MSLKSRHDNPAEQHVCENNENSADRTCTPLYSNSIFQDWLKKHNLISQKHTDHEITTRAHLHRRRPISTHLLMYSCTTTKFQIHSTNTQICRHNFCSGDPKTSSYSHSSKCSRRCWLCPLSAPLTVIDSKQVVMSHDDNLRNKIRETHIGSEPNHSVSALSSHI